MTQHSATSVPDWIEKWKSFSAYNQPLKGTNIIPCKVPLDSCYQQFFTENEDFYTLDGLLTKLRNEGKEVSLVMDINRSDIYHDSNQYTSSKKLSWFEKTKKVKDFEF